MTAITLGFGDARLFFGEIEDLVVELLELELGVHLVVQPHLVPRIKHHLDHLDFLFNDHVTLLHALLLLERVDAAPADRSPCELVEERIAFSVEFGQLFELGQVLELQSR